MPGLFLTTVTHFEHFLGPRCRTGAGPKLGPSLVPNGPLQGAPRTTQGSPMEPPRGPEDHPFGPSLVPDWAHSGSHPASPTSPHRGSSPIVLPFKFQSWPPFKLLSWFAARCLFRSPSRFPFRFPFRFQLRSTAWFPSRFPFRFPFKLLS